MWSQVVTLSLTAEVEKEVVAASAAAFEECLLPAAEAEGVSAVGVPPHCLQAKGKAKGARVKINSH
jgi:hypothetical protein